MKVANRVVVRGRGTRDAIEPSLATSGGLDFLLSSHRCARINPRVKYEGGRVLVSHLSLFHYY